MFPGEEKEIGWVNLDDDLINDSHDYPYKDDLEIELHFYFLVFILLKIFLQLLFRKKEIIICPN